jgi:hypothetical protein
LEYSHFHGTLIEIGRLVLDHLDSNNLVRSDVLAFGDLPERPLPEDIENEVSVENGRQGADEQ